MEKMNSKLLLPKMKIFEQPFQTSGVKFKHKPHRVRPMLKRATATEKDFFNCQGCKPGKALQQKHRPLGGTNGGNLQTKKLVCPKSSLDSLEAQILRHPRWFLKGRSRE